MKKVVIGSLVAMLVAVGIFSSGCKLTPEQVQVISQNAGLGAAVTWIAYDNPDTNVIAAVKETVKIIQDRSSSVKTGETFTAVIYPEVQKYVDSGKLPPQYKPLVLAGSLGLLNGIDLLFAMNPSWKADKELAAASVSSFCIGAIQGLSLRDTDPIIVQARSMSANRVKAFATK